MLPAHCYADSADYYMIRQPLIYDADGRDRIECRHGTFIFADYAMLRRAIYVTPPMVIAALMPRRDIILRCRHASVIFR